MQERAALESVSKDKLLWRGCRKLIRKYSYGRAIVAEPILKGFNAILAWMASANNVPCKLCGSIAIFLCWPRGISLELPERERYGVGAAPLHCHASNHVRIQPVETWRLRHAGSRCMESDGC